MLTSTGNVTYTQKNSVKSGDSANNNNKFVPKKKKKKVELTAKINI